MKIDTGTVLAFIIVTLLITGGGAALGAVLFATYGSNIETCVTIGITSSWIFFILQYKKGNKILNIPE